MAANTVDMHLVARAGLPSEVRAPIQREGVVIEGLAFASYRVEVGDRTLGWVRLGPTRGARFSGSCRDDCALEVTVVTDGCADGVLVELLAPDDAVLETERVSVSDGEASLLWGNLACGTRLTVEAEAAGCTPLQSEVLVDQPFAQLRLELPASEPYRVRAVDLAGGSPIPDAFVTWTRSLGDARFEAGTWEGQPHVVVVEAPPWATLRIEAPGYVPRKLERGPAQAPGEVAELCLQVLGEVEVRCTLDEVPCDSARVDLFSAWFVYMGPVETDPCRPVKPEGTYLCPTALDETGDNSPYVDGYVDGTWTGRVDYAAPPSEPIELAMVTAPAGGSTVCAQLSPPQSEPCELSYLSRPGSIGSVSYSSGEEEHIEAEAGTRVTLACADGFAELQSGEAGCTPLDLEPWGAVCVEHRPALRCVLDSGPSLGSAARPGTPARASLRCVLDSGPSLGVVSVEGCNDRVPAGRYEVECRASTDDENMAWEACGPIDIEAGETAEIRCW